MRPPRLTLSSGVRLLLMMLLAAWPSPAAADQLSPDQLAVVRYDQHLGAAIPLDLTFRDETGTAVHLDQFFGARPVLLRHRDRTTILKFPAGLLVDVDTPEDYEEVKRRLSPGA